MSDPESVVHGPALFSPPGPAGFRRVVHARRRNRDFALRRALLLADLLGLCLALGLALVLSGHREAPLVELLWVLLTLPLWSFLLWSYGLYRRPIHRLEPTHLDDIPSLFHALVLGGLGLWLFYRFVAPVAQLNVDEMLIFWLLALLLIASLRGVVRSVNRRLQAPERVFAIAPFEDVKLLDRKLRNHPEYEMKLVGAATCEGGVEELGLDLAGGVEEVEALLASGQIDHLVLRLDAAYLPQERLQELMRACHREGVRFGCFPGVKALLFPGIEINHIEGMGILTSNPPVFSRTSKQVKRGLDLVVSSVLLALTAPLAALAALAIKLDSRGPVLYRQVRVGRHGQRFQLLKFRTMAPDADRLVEGLMAESKDPDWLILDQDPRVTRFGRFLRRSSIDELPQLWNVLKGEMSLVGPRPLPERDDLAVRDWKRHRLDLIPGLTGSWQVLGRSNIPFQEMLEIDYAYVATWSLWNDMKILARTASAVVLRRGAN
jgi:exopolysaccharide biosynthesis polyprenyl glycosylphosphotransferase